MKRFLPVAGLFLLLALAAPHAAAQSPATVAEKSNFTATSKHAEEVDFCGRLAKLSPLVRLCEIGVSTEGRTMSHDDPATITLYRPVGEKELALIRASGYRAFPPACRSSRSSTQCSSRSTPRRSPATGTPISEPLFY